MALVEFIKLKFNMDKSIRYFYYPTIMTVKTSQNFMGLDSVEIKAGYILSDGKVVVDDREKSISEMFRDGTYNPEKNAILTSVVLNPLIYL